MTFNVDNGIDNGRMEGQIVFVDKMPDILMMSMSGDLLKLMLLILLLGQEKKNPVVRARPTAFFPFAEFFFFF